MKTLDIIITILLIVLLILNIIRIVQANKVEVKQQPPYTNPPTLPKNIYYDIPLNTQEQDFIIDICNKINLNAKKGQITFTPTLIYAIMQVESNFKRDSISITNDYGIMQVNKSYFWDYYYSAEYLKIRSPHNKNTGNYLDFYNNVIAGCKALYYWAKDGETVENALNHYNQGFKIINTHYAEKVLAAERRIKCLEVKN